MALPISVPGQHSISARPRPDESLISYIFRLAARRRLPAASGLATSIGFHRFTNQPHREWLEALAASAQVPVAELDAISYGPLGDSFGWFRGIMLPISTFDRRGGAGRRVCPACLSEHKHHRAVWDLMFIAVCPVHAVRLVDTCQACGTLLRWVGNDLGRCVCLADLTRMTAEPVPEADLHGTKAAHGLLGDYRFREQAGYVLSLEPFRDLGPGRIVEFLFRIGRELVSTRPQAFSLEQPGELAWEAHIVLNRGLELSEKWPTAFYEALEMMRVRSGDVINVNLEQSVGAVERWLAGLPNYSGTDIRLATADFRAQVLARHRAETYGR